MRLRPTFVHALILSLSTAGAVPAQVTFKTTGYEIRDAFADVIHIWTSPAHSEKRDWVGVLGVTAGAVALLPVDDQIDSWIVRHPNSVFVKATTPWNEDHPEFGDLSTGQRLLPISGVLIASGMLSDNRKLREAGWGCLSAWQASSTVRQVLYAAVSRERPSLDNGDQYAFAVPGGDWNYHSFFGGHAANAFACTAFWNSRFHMGALEPVLYVAAAGISLSRMTDRRHWASDTWIGAATGYAMGRSIAARYARRESKRERKAQGEPIRAGFLEGIQVAPMGTRGIGLTWAGTFR